MHWSNGLRLMALRGRTVPHFGRMTVALVAFATFASSSAQTRPMTASEALDSATQANLRGRNDESRAHFENALRLFRESADGIGQANVLLGLGELERKLRRNYEARKYYDDARRGYQIGQGPLGEANVLLGLGHLERDLGRNDVARKQYEGARLLFRSANDRHGEVNVLLGLADLERKLNRNDESRKYYEDAKRLSHADQNRVGEANALRGLGELERALDRKAEARRNYVDAQTLFRAVEDRLGEANVLLGLGELERTLDRRDQSRKYFDEAIRIFQAEQNRLGEANVLLGFGELERTAGRNDRARRNYEDARRLFQAVEDRLGEARVLNELGELETSTGRNDVAREYFMDAIRFFRAEQNRLGEADALMQLGFLERKIGRDAEARQHFRDSAINYGLAGMLERQRDADAQALVPKKMIDAKVPAVPASTPWWRSWQLTGFPSGAAVALLAVLWWYRRRARLKHHASRNTQQSPEEGKRWLNHHSDSRTAVIFVHGILSNPAGFRFSETVSWPQTLYDDSRAGQPNIYLGQYYTATDSGFFDIPAASEELRVQLNSDSVDGSQAPLRSERIIFIVHSTGGLVVRDLLTRHPDLFKGKQVGLVLVASPSRGSAWANRLNMLIDVANNKMAGQLQKGNEWTDDLDKRFADFVHKSDSQRGFSIKGVDLFENRFVARNFWLLRWLIPTRTVVVSERDSSSYFGAGKMVPGTDHFSIAKPSGVDHPSHQYLMEWWQRTRW